MGRFFLVQIILVLRDNSRLRTNPPRRRNVGIPFWKMSWKKPFKIAFDEFYSDAIGDKIVTWEPIPFLAIAQSQVKVFDRRKINPRPFVLLLSAPGRNDRRRKNSSDVQEMRELNRLKVIRDGKWGMIILPICCNPGCGQDGSCRKH